MKVFSKVLLLGMIPIKKQTLMERVELQELD